MRPREIAALLGLLALLSAAAAAPPGPDPEAAVSEKTLRDAGQATDDAGLLKFFRRRTLTEADRNRLARAVRNLGADAFADREQAGADLVRAGRPALRFLEPALHDRDPEVVRRAERCVEMIRRKPDTALVVAAARLLAARRPGDVAEVLLAYLPQADDETVEEAVLQALGEVGRKGDKADPLLAAAVTDREPARRMAAALVLGRGGPEERRAVGPLLADPDPRVRFRAAAALVRAGDRSAVPVLLALLTDGPVGLAWQAEDLLLRVAGDDPPRAALGAADAAARRKCRQAWEGWWQAHEARADLAGLARAETPRGLTVVCDCDVGGRNRPGRVWECGPDGEPRWQITDVHAPADVQLLPGDRVLVAEGNGMVVTERDREGKVLWRRRVNAYATSCRRLPNGNTFIGTYTELLEVTPDGKAVRTFPRRASAYRVQRLGNGHLVFADGAGRIVELDAAGQEVRSVPVPGGTGPWAGVEVLPNGRYLVALYTANKVLELDPAGTVCWQCTVNTPSSATRLPDGKTLISSMDARLMVEVDRAGKETWRRPTQGRPFFLLRH
jgi:hypothetical protein